MGFFNKILSSIFSHAPAQPNQPTQPTASQTPGAPANQQASTPGGGTSAASQGAATPSPAPATSSAASTVAPAQVDVETVLAGLAAKNSEKLDWKKSIVDLLKLLDLDSSLSARKELATELHYSGDTSDSAAMNIWLHKAVLKKLSENGGKVPADLLD